MDDLIRAEISATHPARLESMQLEACAGRRQARSILACRLLRLCAAGALSPNLVQWLAEGAELDGFTNNDLHTLAHAGTNGMYPANVRRDVFSRVGKESLVKQPEFVKLFMDAGKGKVEEVAHPLVPPAAIADALRATDRVMFDTLIGRS